MEFIDMSEDADKVMTEDFLDCNGKTRVFRLGLSVHEDFLQAMELKDGEPTGFRFFLEVEPDRPPPWGEMRCKIRKRLSQRDLVRDDKGELQDLHRLIRAQITDPRERSTPILLIDDMEVAWEELGEMLMTYAGWGLRIQICDSGDE